MEISNEIKKEQNKRYRILKLYKSNEYENTWSSYKAVRNRVKKLIRDAEISDWGEQLAKTENSKPVLAGGKEGSGKRREKVNTTSSP